MVRKLNKLRMKIIFLGIRFKNSNKICNFSQRKLTSCRRKLKKMLNKRTNLNKKQILFSKQKGKLPFFKASCNNLKLKINPT